MVSLSVWRIEAKLLSNRLTMMKVEETGPFVIQNLLPLRMYRSPFFSAVVFMLTTSLPAPGSLMAREPTFVPAIKSGRYLSFCLAVPCRLIWLTHRFE